MKISQVRFTPQLKPQQTQLKQDVKNNTSYNYDYKYASTSQIPFCAALGIKPKKLLNFDIEKNKVLKQLAEMFELQPNDLTRKEIAQIVLNDSIRHLRAKNKRLKEIKREVEWIDKDKKLKLKQKFDMLRELQKESIRLEKSKAKLSIDFNKKTDDKTDFVLLNKIRAALMKNNLNLKEIFLEHFKGLNEIKTLEELAQMYPKIKVPPRPQEVVGKKIENSLTKEFYEEFANIFHSDKKKAFKLANSVVKEKIALIAEKYGLNPKELYVQVAKPTFRAIANRFKYVRENGYATINTTNSKAVPQLEEVDIKLLSINFDDFVLSTYRKHYLNSEKINDIIYTEGDVKIPVKSLGNSQYKLGKLHPKIQQIINSGEHLQTVQRNYELSLRDYDVFDFQTLQKRLDFYGNHQIANNEELFKVLANFSECLEADTPELKILLRELDEIQDGNKTVEEVLQKIWTEDIKPKEQLRINEHARKEAFEQTKLRQQKESHLNLLKDELDEITDKLYKHNLNTLAVNISDNYRPTSIDGDTAKDCRYIIDTVKKHFEAPELNRNKLESDISNWETYKLYQECESTNPIFLKAVEYATDSNGKIDITKAGQYIKNAEIVEEYISNGTNLHPEPELFEQIITNGNRVNIVEYLCKYDDYQDLAPSTKTHLSKYINMFDKENEIEYDILEHIIRNDYVNNDTLCKTKIHNTSDKYTDAIIASSAKKQILKKYRFPNCIKFLQGFENAIVKPAGERSDSGLKLTGSNNKKAKYRMEVKLSGHNDRLFSSNNDFYFDIFDEKGLH